MFLWLQNNLGTVITAIVLGIAVICVIIVMLRNKKRGKSSCGGGCAGCAMASTCHKRTDNHDLNA